MKTKMRIARKNDIKNLEMEKNMNIKNYTQKIYFLI